MNRRSLWNMAAIPCGIVAVAAAYNAIVHDSEYAWGTLMPGIVLGCVGIVAIEAYRKRLAG